MGAAQVHSPVAGSKSSAEDSLRPAVRQRHGALRGAEPPARRGEFVRGEPRARRRDPGPAGRRPVQARGERS